METTGTTCKNNIFFLAAKPRGDLETGRGCARMARVVFISCHRCFLFNETYPHLHSCGGAGGGLTGRTGVPPVPWTGHVRTMQRTRRPLSQLAARRDASPHHEPRTTSHEPRTGDHPFTGPGIEPLPRHLPQPPTTSHPYIGVWEVLPPRVVVGGWGRCRRPKATPPHGSAPKCPLGGKGFFPYLPGGTLGPSDRTDAPAWSEGIRTLVRQPPPTTPTYPI